MYVLLAIILIILISVAASTYKYGIGPTPTSPKVKSALMKVLPLIPPGKIFELGAGFGGIAFALADHYPNHLVIAFEISIFPYLWMKARQFVFPKKNLQIRYIDFFKINLMEAELIICYLYPGAMKKLEPLVIDKCIISHTFALPNRKMDQVFFAKDLYHTPIYIYEKRNH